MMRLCVLGNSHVGALKRAADEVCLQNPDLRLGFFAARSNQTRDMTIRDGRYCPTSPALADQLALTSGGLRDIDPAAWDAYLIYGFGGRRRQGDTPRRFSKTFRQAVVLERLRGSLLPAHARALRSLTDRPIFAALAPLAAQTGDKPALRLLPPRAESALVQAHICDPLGVTLVPQPEISLAGKIATRPELSQDAVTLEQAARETKADPQKHRHMNAAYGKLWLTEFLRQLRRALADCRPQEA